MKEQMSVSQLKNTCIDLKKHVIDMIYKAQSGHPGGHQSGEGASPSPSSSRPAISAR